MIKKITFEIETITPMFLSGADQGKAELRASSIKGLLRFWWRALQAESDLDKLRKKESQIFGSSEEGGGGSSFGIRVIAKDDLKPTKNKFPDNPRYKVQVEGKPFKINILEYLAYGTYEYVQRQGNVFTREYYPEKKQFDIILNFRDVAWQNDVLKAFYAFCIFSGVGSRSRNGFGSLNIANMEKSFENIKDIISVKNPYGQENLKKIIKGNSITSYPSFTKGAKLFKTKQTSDSGLDTLADVGKIYKKGRGRLEKRHLFDKRQYIGSPIVEKTVTKSFLDRHAKPYFIKVAKEGNKYRTYVLYLPSRYCDGLEKDRNNRSINHNSEDRRFAEICTEFNGFLADNMDTVI